MAGTTVDVGSGTTVAFTTGGFSAELIDVQWSGITRGSIETTHMGTTATAAAGATFGSRTFMPTDFTDPGELTLEYHFDPDITPPIEDATGDTVTVTWPKAAGDSSAAKWVGTGFVTGYTVNDPMEDKQTATLVFKLSALVTKTAAA